LHNDRRETRDGGRKEIRDVEREIVLITAFYVFTQVVTTGRGA